MVAKVLPNFTGSSCMFSPKRISSVVTVVCMFSKLLYVNINAQCIFQQNSDYGMLET